jgi:hypothetical protein
MIFITAPSISASSCPVARDSDHYSLLAKIPTVSVAPRRVTLADEEMVLIASI